MAMAHHAVLARLGLEIGVVARKSATSASTAWVNRARAPLRRISVRESVKAPGWASLITLVSDTAYHSFIGEVEALNTTTIRRLTLSRRHQHPAIAPPPCGCGGYPRTDAADLHSAFISSRAVVTCSPPGRTDLALRVVRNCS